jgi:hypothetical protein
VLLALLGHFGADRAINTLLTPVTAWWLGLPLALGVPILFGVLRKELSLLMIYQAMGTQDLGSVLAPLQMLVLLAFISFYVPCVSTFAVMLKNPGPARRLAVGVDFGRRRAAGGRPAAVCRRRAGIAGALTAGGLEYPDRSRGIQHGGFRCRTSISTAP